MSLTCVPKLSHIWGWFFPKIAFQKNSPFFRRLLSGFHRNFAGRAGPVYKSMKKAIMLEKSLDPVVHRNCVEDNSLDWNALSITRQMFLCVDWRQVSQQTICTYLEEINIKYYKKTKIVKKYGQPTSRNSDSDASVVSEVKNIQQWQRRIMQKMKEIDVKVIQTMFLGIRKQSRKSPIMDDIVLVLHRFL